MQLERNQSIVQRMQSGILYENIRSARTGRKDSAYTSGIHPDPTVGLADGYIWVRDGEDGDRSQTVALVVSVRDDIADIPVLIGELIVDGTLCAISPDINPKTVAQYGSSLAATGVPATPSEWQRQPVDGLYLSPGSVRPSTLNPGTLFVYIQPFMYQGRWYGGIDHDVGTANVPGTSGQVRWVTIVLNTGNTPSTVTATARVFVDIENYPVNDSTYGLNSITLPAGSIPVGACTLAYGQTDIANSRFVDWREWVEARGTLLSETSATLTIASGAVTAGSGSFFVLAAESGTADDLDTITVAGPPRMVVLQADTGDTITVKHSTDNIELNAGTDYALSGDKTLALFWDGTNLSDIAATIAGGNVDITSLTATTVVDATADYLVIYDDSASANRKVQPQYLPSSSSNLDWIVIRDKKTQNTVGGTFTSGAWQTRTLNEELVDPGGHASLSSNQITLVAGTYRCEIRCPALQVNSHQARLQDITNTATLVTGTSEYTRSLDTVVTNSVIVGRFTLAGSTVVEVQHRCSSTSPDTQGFGVPANLTDEVYTIAQFWKEA